MMAIVWMLAVGGYIGVDDRKFDTLDACRDFAKNRIVEMHQESEEIVWQCYQVDFQQKAPKELPAKYLENPTAPGSGIPADGRTYYRCGPNHDTWCTQD